jgi:hypothetical protein
VAIAALAAPVLGEHVLLAELAGYDAYMAQVSDHAERAR